MGGHPTAYLVHISRVFELRVSSRHFLHRISQVHDCVADLRFQGFGGGEKPLEDVLTRLVRFAKGRFHTGLLRCHKTHTHHSLLHLIARGCEVVDAAPQLPPKLWKNREIYCPINQSTDTKHFTLDNQSIKRSNPYLTIQSINQSINQNKSLYTTQSINQSINQSMTESCIKSTNQVFLFDICQHFLKFLHSSIQRSICCKDGIYF